MEKEKLDLILIPIKISEHKPDRITWYLATPKTLVDLIFIKKTRSCS